MAPNALADNDAREPSRSAPRWLIFLTVGLTLLILMMAVAETSLWTHFFIDTGEYISLIGLAFILIVGLFLHRSGRLLASLPLVLPWLIYPVVTQGDQIIDNLNIQQMRWVTHVILAILFGSPIAVLVLAARHLLAPAPGAPPRRRAWTVVVPGLRHIEQGRLLVGGALMALTLLLLEVWVAYEYLGKLMLLTLIAMGLGVLFWVAVADTRVARGGGGRLSQRLVLVLFLVGVAGSAGLYLAFKHRPGAYQGSPHYFHDPGQKDAVYDLEAVRVPESAPRRPTAERGAEIRAVLDGYAEALLELSGAYYVLDRNYNYAFHNELFMRNTPVLPDFRKLSLARIEEATRRAEAADERWRALAPAPDDPLSAFVEEVRLYTAFNFRRAAILEDLTADFARTRAGLQHATHVYEGEGKVLGVWLADILGKHAGVLAAPEAAGVTAGFVEAGHRIHDSYANRIVGF